MTLKSKLLENNHRGHRQRIDILHLVHLNSGQQHFVLTSDYEAVKQCWISLCQGQVFHPTDDKVHPVFDRIRICKTRNPIDRI